MDTMLIQLEDAHRFLLIVTKLIWMEFVLNVELDLYFPTVSATEKSVTALLTIKLQTYADNVSADIS